MVLGSVEYGNFSRLVVVDGCPRHARRVIEKLFQLNSLVVKDLDSINRVLSKRHQSPLDCNRLDSLFGVDGIPTTGFSTRDNCQDRRPTQSSEEYEHGVSRQSLVLPHSIEVCSCFEGAEILTVGVETCGETFLLSQPFL